MSFPHPFRLRDHSACETPLSTLAQDLAENKIGFRPYAVGPYAVGMAMWLGALEFDLLLGDVHSLKEKRSVVRPLIAEVRKRFELSVAEVDHLELHRRAAIGVAAVSSDRTHLVKVLDAVEQLVAYRPDIELLSVRRTLRSGDD
jgi:uncharacterized protein